MYSNDRESLEINFTHQSLRKFLPYVESSPNKMYSQQGFYRFWFYTTSFDYSLEHVALFVCSQFIHNLFKAYTMRYSPFKISTLHMSSKIYFLMQQTHIQAWFSWCVLHHTMFYCWIYFLHMKINVDFLILLMLEIQFVIVSQI